MPKIFLMPELVSVRRVSYRYFVINVEKGVHLWKPPFRKALLCDLLPFVSIPRFNEVSFFLGEWQKWVVCETLLEGSDGVVGQNGIGIWKFCISFLMSSSLCTIQN